MGDTKSFYSSATARAREPKSRWPGLLTCLGLLSTAMAFVGAGCAPAPTMKPAMVAEAFDWQASKGVIFRVDPPPAIAGYGQPLPAPLPSYILGTYHSGMPDALGIDMDRLRALVTSRRRLVTEASAGTPLDEKSAARRLLADDDRLSRLLGEQGFSRLKAALPGISPAFLEHAKPWVALTLLEVGDDGSQPSLDALVESWAVQAGLTRTYLETIELQVAALDCVPAAEQAAVLRDRLDNAWSFADETARALAYYRAGDLPGWLMAVRNMDGLSEQSRSAERQAQRCLIGDRNQRWLPQLLPVLREGDSFIAVGGLHLAGEDGLLAQLSRQGFQITAVPVQPVNGRVR